MADPASIAKRHALALTELSEILTKHDPDVGERVRRAKNGGGIPSPSKKPLETAALHAECMRSLARLMDRELTPRRRGRPPKAS
jgi:hypothetical protein